MSVKVDALRVVQDPKYAASLSDAHWRALINDPAWNELVGEYHELTAPVMELYAAQLGVPLAKPVSASEAVADTPSAAKGESFQVVGKHVPRLHGLGIVTSLGQYTENMRMNGMLYTRTLRSPHPHAKIKSVNTKKAEALPGVVAVLHRGNLPANERRFWKYAATC